MADGNGAGFICISSTVRQAGNVLRPARETNPTVKLAEDLLLLARACSGSLPLHLVSLSVAELVAELGKRFAPIVARSGRVLIIDCTRLGVDTSLCADPNRIRQAISNLVDNSLRYGDGAVTLSARQAEGCVQLHVSDQGAGFGEELAACAFDRFSRGDLARSRGDAGLGLTIARAIAQAHGGDADACNLPQGGADVWITIPSTNARSSPNLNRIGCSPLTLRHAGGAFTGV